MGYIYYWFIPATHKYNGCFLQKEIGRKLEWLSSDFSCIYAKDP